MYKINYYSIFNIHKKCINYINQTISQYTEKIYTEGN